MTMESVGKGWYDEPSTKSTFKLQPVCMSKRGVEGRMEWHESYATVSINNDRVFPVREGEWKEAVPKIGQDMQGTIPYLVVEAMNKSSTKTLPRS